MKENETDFAAALRKTAADYLEELAQRLRSAMPTDVELDAKPESKEVAETIRRTRECYGQLECLASVHPEHHQQAVRSQRQIQYAMRLLIELVLGGKDEPAWREQARVFLLANLEATREQIQLMPDDQCTVEAGTIVATMVPTDRQGNVLESALSFIDGLSDVPNEVN